MVLHAISVSAWYGTKCVPVYNCTAKRLLCASKQWKGMNDGYYHSPLPHKGGRPLERGHDQDRLRKQIMSFRHSVRGQV